MLSLFKKIWLFSFFWCAFLFFWTALVSASADPVAEVSPTKDTFWVNMDPACLLDGTCTFSIYDATKIKADRAPGERTSTLRYIQDILLAATTFIGVVVTLALIISGLMYIFSTVDNAMKNKAKSGMKYALIGMVVVMLSLIIIRLVQFLARGGS